jgi:hypothetical protein
MHIPWLNHIVNLVFTHTIKSDFFSEVFAMLPEICRTLHSAQSIHILGRGCPKLIRITWVSLVDVLAFLIDRINDVHTALALADVAPITTADRRAHVLLLPLS